MDSCNYELDYELYRNSSLGKSLTVSLDELVGNGTISPLLAVAVAKQFDQSLNRSFFSEKVKTKMKFTGHLHTYRFVDDVWTFVLENAQFKLKNGETIDVPDRLKIVASTAQIFSPQKEDHKKVLKRETKKARRKIARDKKNHDSSD